MKRPWGRILLALLTLAIAACSLILGIPSDRFVADGGCDVPDGFAGGSCYRCDPQNSNELLNACSSQMCDPFNNYTRIANYDGGVPPLPGIPDGGSGAPSDAQNFFPNDGGTGPCTALPNPVYLYGSTGLSGVMPVLAQAIAAANPTITIVYTHDVSCNGLDSILTGNTMMTGLGQYWTANSMQPQNCDLPDQGLHPDIGLCDVFPESCVQLSQGLPANIGDFLGQVQVFMFTVPRASMQNNISAESAYRVYGYGNNSGVKPWTDERYLAKRFDKSGNQTVIGAGIGLPSTMWRGDTVLQSSDMVPHLMAYPNPDQAIGIISADVADAQRNVVRTLAYQHYGQDCAFLPDSELGASDKKNVRDGHYFLWAPIHFYTHIDGSGVPVNKRAGQVIDFLTGAVPLPNPNVDVIGAYKTAGLIPQCAMAVTRTSEGGALSPMQPMRSCACAFEKASPGGSGTECIACTKPSDCPQATPSCNFGYCEIK
jgi:hypothetical protein